MAEVRAHEEPTRRLPAEVRRQRLLEVAREAFVANAAGASMRQIAGQAEVDPALLYRHFSPSST